MFSLLSPGSKLNSFVIAVATMATNHHFTHEASQQIKEGIVPGWFPLILYLRLILTLRHSQPCHCQLHTFQPLCYIQLHSASIFREEIGWLPGCYFYKTVITRMEHSIDRCTRNFAEFSKDKFSKKELRHLLLR